MQANPEPSDPVKPSSGFTTIGNELNETAPLWRVYRDEVRNHDRDVTFDEWNKTLDILLIFAGLFSAVVTSFLLASVPLLTPEDENTSVVNAIHALAMAINSSITLPAPQPPDPVTASTLWVNGLWFMSLFLALAVAFFAILAKQWLVKYNHRMANPPAAVPASSPARSNTTASSSLMHSSVAPDESANAPPQLVAHADATFPTASLAWAHRRQFFFAAFTDWHIPALVTQTLPFLLHVALFLFLVGLSIFVWTLNTRIARGISAVTVLLFCLYLIATVLPVFRAECPTATPLVRRAREIPYWIAIKAVQFWGVVLPLACRAFGPSRVTSHDVKPTLNELRQRQKNIRDSGWVDGGGTTEDKVKLDTLQWLILVSGSETAVNAAFQALGALPANSPYLPALRTITAGMDTAVERLGSSLVPPTAVEIVRAVRTEFIFGRGSWDLPLLGLDLSPSLRTTLKESQHPDARLLSAAMHLDGTHYPDYRGVQKRSFLSLYDITDTLLRADGSSDLCLSTVRLLLELPHIPLPAFACLCVVLARSLHLDEFDKDLIDRIFEGLYRSERDPPEFQGPCGIVVWMVYHLYVNDPATLKIVPIILSHLLPCLAPEFKRGNEGLVPESLFRAWTFLWAIAHSDWVHSPCPTGNTDVAVLSTLMSGFDWSYASSREAYLRILEWFIVRRQYQTLRSPDLIAKLRNTLSEPDTHPSMLRALCHIVHLIVTPEYDNYDVDALREFVRFLISLCGDLSPIRDEDTWDVLFRVGLVPAIGACLGRMQSNQWIEDEREMLFHMVDAALGYLAGHVESKEEYLLHLAQHCVLLDPEWMRREEVGAHLDARRMGELLVQKGPCTKCTEGSRDKWPNFVLTLLRARTPTVEQSPQPGPSALPPRDAVSTLLAPSAPAILSTVASPPDVASPSLNTPNAISVFRVDSGAMPMLQAATGSGPDSPSAGSNPVIATISVSPGYAVLVSPSDSTPAVNASSGTTPHAVIASSSRTPDTPPGATAPTEIRIPEVSLTTTSPAGLDDIVSPVTVVSQTGPASRGDGASTAYDPSSDFTSSVGQCHNDCLTPSPRAVSSLLVADGAPSAAAATSSAATGSSSTSALDVPTTASASTASLPAIASSPYAAATTTSSPDLTAAHSPARTARASPSDSADSEVDETAGVHVDPGSSAA